MCDPASELTIKFSMSQPTGWVIVRVAADFGSVKGSGRSGEAGCVLLDSLGSSC